MNHCCSGVADFSKLIIPVNSLRKWCVLWTACLWNVLGSVAEPHRLGYGWRNPDLTKYREFVFFSNNSAFVHSLPQWKGRSKNSEDHWAVFSQICLCPEIQMHFEKRKALKFLSSWFGIWVSHSIHVMSTMSRGATMQCWKCIVTGSCVFMKLRVFSSEDFYDSYWMNLRLYKLWKLRKLAFQPVYINKYHIQYHVLSPSQPPLWNLFVLL